MVNFISRLMAALDNFDLKEALKLSTRIHDAEAGGYSVSKQEDKLWLALTDRVELEREKMRD